MKPSPIRTLGIHKNWTKATHQSKKNTKHSVDPTSFTGHAGQTPPHHTEPRPDLRTEPRLASGIFPDQHRSNRGSSDLGQTTMSSKRSLHPIHIVRSSLGFPGIPREEHKLPQSYSVTQPSGLQEWKPAWRWIESG